MSCCLDFDYLKICETSRSGYNRKVVGSYKELSEKCDIPHVLLKYLLYKWNAKRSCKANKHLGIGHLYNTRVNAIARVSIHPFTHSFPFQSSCNYPLTPTSPENAALKLGRTLPLSPIIKHILKHFTLSSPPIFQPISHIYPSKFSSSNKFIHLPHSFTTPKT